MRKDAYLAVLWLKTAILAAPNTGVYAKAVAKNPSGSAEGGPA
jgi:hypothetical protein